MGAVEQLPELIAVLSDAGGWTALAAFLITSVVAFVKGWVVPGTTHEQIVTRETAQRALETAARQAAEDRLDAMTEASRELNANVKTVLAVFTDEERARPRRGRPS